MKSKNYIKYPFSSILLYNGVTILHFLLGGIGIIIGYDFTNFNYLLGILYLGFSFTEMYILMPIMVCPNCIYHILDNSCCISGLNIISKKVTKKGEVKNFGKRSIGLFSHNKLYMAGLFIPIILMVPALLINFSFILLIILLMVIGLLIFRIFFIFFKIACIHCRARNICLNAKSMGIK